VSIAAASHLFENSMSNSITADTDEQRWLSAKAGEIDLYRKAKQAARDLGLSGDDMTQYLQPHLDRWQQFVATRPGHGTGAANVSPPSPSSGSAASSQVGGVHLHVLSGVHPADGSVRMGRFSMGWFRRKARGKSAADVAVRA
jgi:hypothetical protein